jgi:hypothetical protein
MKNGLAYRVRFTNVDAQVVTILIYDTLVQIEDDQDVEIIDLEGAGDPCHLSTIDNDEDKFTPIKAKQCITRFNSSVNYNRTTFAEGPDNRFYKTVDIGAQRVFNGFLSLDDISESFLPPRNVVTLTATDKIGALKDVPLTDDDGNNPLGKYRIGELIAMCLKKTGMNLPIKVVNSLKHGRGNKTLSPTWIAAGVVNLSVPYTDWFYLGQVFTTNSGTNPGPFTVLDVQHALGFTLLALSGTVTDQASTPTIFTDITSQGHFYDQIYIDAKTFEAEVGASEDCYTVLEKILGEDCFVTQYKGEWLIVRVDELDGDVEIANFDADGNYIDTDAPASFNVNIGLNEPIYFSQEATLVVSQRPHGFVKETFNYESPAEILCNPDFGRGELTDDVSATEKRYAVECWKGYRANYPSSDVIAPTTDIYTRKDFLDGYEIARYVVIEAVTAPNSNLIMSAPIEMGAKDKFSITVSRRMSADVGSSGPYTDTLAQVRLYGSNGTYYTLHGGTITDALPLWVATDQDFSSDQQLIQYQGDVGEDQTNTVSKTVDAPPLPVTGYIRVMLYQSALWGDTLDTYIEPVQFTYTPYINGAYQIFTGHYNKVDRATAQGSGVVASGYLATRDNEVFIGDSPKKIFKGAMFIAAIGAELYDGSIQFTGTGFTLAGDQTGVFRAGMSIYIESASYSGYYLVTDATYFIIGSTTSVTMTPAGGPVITEAGTIHEGVFHLASRFYTTDADNANPYGYHQVFSVWNQFFQALSVFQYSLQGGMGTLPPDLINHFTLLDGRADSLNRNFMLVTFDHDLFLCESVGTLVEILRVEPGKVYGDVWSIKYKTNANNL